MEEESRRFLDELASGVRMDHAGTERSRSGRSHPIIVHRFRPNLLDLAAQIANGRVALLLAALVDGALDGNGAGREGNGRIPQTLSLPQRRNGNVIAAALVDKKEAILGEDAMVTGQRFGERRGPEASLVTVGGGDGVLDVQSIAHSAAHDPRSGNTIEMVRCGGENGRIPEQRRLQHCYLLWLAATYVQDEKLAAQWWIDGQMIAEAGEAVAGTAVKQNCLIQFAAQAQPDQFVAISFTDDGVDTAVPLHGNVFDKATGCEEMARGFRNWGMGDRDGSLAGRAVAAVGRVIKAAVRAGGQIGGIIGQQVGGEGEAFAFVKEAVDGVQQVVGQGVRMAGGVGIGNGRVQHTDLSLRPRRQRFVLFVYATVRVNLQQTFDQQNGKGVPIGQRREIRLLAKIGDVVERRVEEGGHGHRAGEVGELVAVGVDEGRGRET